MILASRVAACFSLLVAGVVGATTVLITPCPHSALAQVEQTDAAADEETQEALAIDFGLSRQPLSRTVTVTILTDDASQVGDVSIELLGDLSRVGGSGQFPAGQVTPSAASSGTTVRVTAAADPLAPEEVDAGTYEGAMKLSGQGIETTDIPLIIDLDSREGSSMWWAMLALFLGASFGAAVRWLNDEGQTLGRLRRRYRRIVERLGPESTADLPDIITLELNRAATALNQREIAAARDAIEKLEKCVEYAPMSESLRMMRESIELQQNIAADYGVASYVRQMIAAERQRMRGLKAARDLSAAQAEAKAEVRYFLGFERVVRVLADLQERIESAEGAPEIGLVNARRDAAQLASDIGNERHLSEAWEKYGNTINSLPPSGDIRPSDRPTFVTKTARSVLLPIWRRLQKWWDVRLALTIAAATLITLLGLDLLYFGDPAFDGEVRQYLLLAAWAAGLQVVGVELAQLGSQLYGRRPPLPEA